MLIRIHWEFKAGKYDQTLVQRYVPNANFAFANFFKRFISSGIIIYFRTEMRLCDSINFMQIWAGPLSRKRVVVVLLNRSGYRAPISVGWREIGLSPFSPVIVRDLWAVSNKLQLPNAFANTSSYHDKQEERKFS